MTLRSIQSIFRLCRLRVRLLRVQGGPHVLYNQFEKCLVQEAHVLKIISQDISYYFDNYTTHGL